MQERSERTKAAGGHLRDGTVGTLAGTCKAHFVGQYGGYRTISPRRGSKRRSEGNYRASSARAIIRKPPPTRDRPPPELNSKKSERRYRNGAIAPQEEKAISCSVALRVLRRRIVAQDGGKGTAPQKECCAHVIKRKLGCSMRGIVNGDLKRRYKCQEENSGNSRGPRQNRPSTTAALRWFQICGSYSRLLGLQSEVSSHRVVADVETEGDEERQRLKKP